MFKGKRPGMALQKLFAFMSTRDSKTIEIYFDFLNVWWLFALWSPSTRIALAITHPLYQYILAIAVVILIVSGTISLLLKRIKFRLFVLLGYMVFYSMTGFTLLTEDPVNFLGGFFILQTVLAIALTWKIQARG